MTDPTVTTMAPAPAQEPVFDVAFVGRANIDLTVRVPHRASPGRTAFADSLTTMPGGKSLNQAIIAARAGAHTCLIANAGDDPWGRQLSTALTTAGVDIRHFSLIPQATTGAAIIEVTPDGESYVTLAISPPTELTASQIVHTLRRLHSRTTVVQLDLPPNPVTTLLTGHRPELFIGNLIPHPDLNPALLRHLDILVVNEHEAAAILRTTLDPLPAATALHNLGPATVIVTAGADGAAWHHHDSTGTIPAPTVPVVDTTGAGDAFLATLATALTNDTPLPVAITAAVNAGATTVQRRGAH